MLKSFSNLHFYLIQSFVSSLLGILVLSFAAKNIDMPSLGGYMLSYSYALVFNSIANVGTLAIYDRNFFEYDSSFQRKEQDLLIRTLLWFNFTVLLISVVVFFFVPDTYFSLINLNKFSYICVSLGTGFNFMSQLLLSRFKNLGEAKKFMIFGVVSPALFLILLLLGLNRGLDYLLIEFSYLAAQAFALIILLPSIIFSKNVKFFDLGILFYSLKISLPSLPRTLVSSLNNQMDRILAGGIGGPSVLALYGIAQLISSSIFLFMTALGREFQPKVYKVIFSNDRCDLAKLLNPYLYLCGFFSLIICLFSEEILLIFFGNEYVSVNVIVSFLSIVYLAMFIGKVNGLQLLAEKKTLITSFVSVVSVLINYSLITPFYEYFSIFGLALAFFFSQIIIIALNYYYAQVYRPLLMSLKLYFTLLFGQALIFALIYSPPNLDYYLFLIFKILIALIYLLLCCVAYFPRRTT